MIILRFNRFLTGRKSRVNKNINHRYNGGKDFFTFSFSTQPQWFTKTL